MTVRGIADPMRVDVTFLRKDMIWSVVMTVVLLVLRAAPALGWEADVHYGLNKWLAAKTGFDSRDAESIAHGTLNKDHGINDARFLVWHYACLGRDIQASELVRDAHFPSFVKLPDEAEARKVVAGSAAATREARKEVEVADTGDREFGLLKFGEALHPLQDSWSHQGVPGIPPLCSSELSWGHPTHGEGGRATTRI